MTFLPPERFNLADYLLDDRVREGRGGRTALRLPDREMTYAEVQALANRFGNVLLAQGVQPEQRVMIALPDGAEFVGALFGVLKIGAVGVMVNPALSPPELARLFEYTRSRLAVVDAAALPAFAGAAGQAETAPRFLTVGRIGGTGGAEGPDGPGGGGVTGGTGGAGSIGGNLAPPPSFEEEAARAGDAGDRLDNARTHRDDPAIWLFSGGTTGRPKAVVQTHTSYANTTHCYAQTFLGYGEDDVTLSVPKLFFGYATGANLFFPFSVGGSAVLFPEKPTPELLFEKIRRHRPTVLVNVPTMVHHLVSHPEAAAQDLSCLRFAISAGETLPVALYERWKETFGVELLDGLGTAEMWHIFLSNHPRDVKPGTLGKAVPGFEVKVCDEEGRELPAGEVGRLWVRGRSRAIGYWQEMEKTAETFRGDWVVTGDLLSRDADGYFTYCGRADDVLKVGGRWVVPGEVESCLIRHPAVAECAVVGIANEDGLTKPRAYVVARDRRPGLEEELKAWVLAELAPYKHPREIVFVDDLPRTHLGKVDRGKLRAQ
jgi:benzoate-CoA ligase family protein